MHYVSADSLWFCSNFSSVLIVTQVVAMGLCFVDAICCVFVKNQNEACLEFEQHSDAVDSCSQPLTTTNNFHNCGCFYQTLAKVFGFRCSQELSENKVDRQGFFGSISLLCLFAPNTPANTKCPWPLITQR